VAEGELVVGVLKVKVDGAWVPVGGSAGGDGGGAAGGTFTFVQATPTPTWNIVHDLGFKPNVQLQVNTVDGPTEAMAEINHVSVNQLIISCAKAVSGEAYLS
jgi:hypothetical protein